VRKAIEDVEKVYGQRVGLELGVYFVDSDAAENLGLTLSGFRIGETIAQSGVVSPPDADRENVDVADRVTPRAGSETLFTDLEDLLAAFKTHLPSRRICAQQKSRALQSGGTMVRTQTVAGVFRVLPRRCRGCLSMM